MGANKGSPSGGALFIAPPFSPNRTLLMLRALRQLCSAIKKFAELSLSCHKSILHRRLVLSFGCFQNTISRGSHAIYRFWNNSFQTTTAIQFWTAFELNQHKIQIFIITPILLYSFLFRTLLFCYHLKKKLPRFLDAKKSQQEYLNLLHDILKAGYSENLAFEVYPKWRLDTKNNLKKSNRCITRKTKILQEKRTNYIVYNETAKSIMFSDVEDFYCNKENDVLEHHNHQTPRKKSDYMEVLVSKILKNTFGHAIVVCPKNNSKSKQQMKMYLHHFQFMNLQ